MTALILTDQDPGEAIGEAITGGAYGASGIEGHEPEATKWVNLPLPTPVVQHLDVEGMRKQDAEKAAHKIIHGVANNKGVIAFPIIIYFFLKLFKSRKRS